MSYVLHSTSEPILKLLETMGLGDKKVTSMHIHFERDDIVTVDVTMLVVDDTGEELLEIMKKYRLEEIQEEDNV